MNFLFSLLASLLSGVILLVVAYFMSGKLRKLRKILVVILGKILNIDIEAIFTKSEDGKDDVILAMKKAKFIKVLTGRGSSLINYYLRSVFEDDRKYEQRSVDILIPKTNLQANEFDWIKYRTLEYKDYRTEYKTEENLKNDINNVANALEIYETKGKLKVRRANFPHIARIVITDKYAYYCGYSETEQTRDCAMIKYSKSSSMYDNLNRLFDHYWSMGEEDSADCFVNCETLVNTNFVEIKTRRECKDIPTIISSAKKEIFISGINMHSLSGLAGDFAKRNDVKLRFLVLNLNNKELVKAYENIRGRTIHGPPSAYHFLRNFINNDNAEIRAVDFLTPAMFIASDMDEDYGFIKVEHLLNDEQYGELPCFELTPKNSSYSLYKEQIEYIWSKAELYQPQEDEN